MKKTLYFIAFHVIFCTSLYSQTKEDFRVYTYLTDTILYGLPNELMIETKWDKSKISLTGNNITIKYNETTKNYEVIAGRYQNGIKHELILNYEVRKNAILTFTYPLKAVHSNPEIINRLRVAKGLPELKIDFLIDEIYVKSRKELESNMPSIIRSHSK